LSRRTNTSGGRKGRRRELLWVSGAVVFVVALLYWEQAALLYVLSTLGVSALLLVVAFSDLDRGHVKSDASTPVEHEAVAVTGEAAPIPPRRALKRTPRSAAGGRLSG
jgi:hypothetical protein